MPRTLHGRAADLALVDDTLAALATGRGRALFLTGEPGIGKSTLLAEAKARAGSAIVLSGAAWESGGAPPYWPWLQVLRDAAALAGERVRTLPGAERIATLVEEWGIAPARGDGGADASAARFGLLDAVVRALLALAHERPLVIVLDDLHAADLPSLDLLVMLVRELPRAPIALVAAWREGELAVNTDAAQRLGRVVRFGDVRAIGRLTADDLAAWVGADAPAIFSATEGNPLFVEELLRARGGTIPSGIANVIADHLALASDSTRELLAMSSVLGRELDLALLARFATEDAIAGALREAAAIGIVDRTPRGYRFRHILLRDHLYEALAPSRRAELHREIGDALAASDAVRAAHHLLAGGSPRAVDAARTAAARASAVYAFEDAAQLLSAALGTLGGAGTTLAIDLRLELAAAHHHVGLVAQARVACVEAADRARALDDRERFARAAMSYAMELSSGGRDPTMIALLDEAERGLPSDDHATRARVMARLAAALVPGAEVDVLRAQELARRAVAMARRLDDPDALLFALRYAGHAHAYQIHIDEALAIAQEVIALSDRLGRPLDAIDHRAWIVGGYLSIGDLTQAQAALAHFETLVAPLPQPQYRWRAPILRAANAMRMGSFDEADRHLSIARAIGHEHAIDRALWSARFAELALALCTRDPVRAAAAAEEIPQYVLARIGLGGENFVACVSAIAGRTEEARARLARAVFFPTLLVLQFGAEAAVLVGDGAAASRLVDVLERQCSLHPLVHGPQGSVFIPPGAVALGAVYTLLGRFDAAIVQLEAGIAHARRIESPTAIAHGCASLARALEQRGMAGDRDRITALRTEAALLAASCGIHGLDATQPPPPRRGDQLAITCGDGRAHIRWNGRSIAVATTKGLEFLAALVAAPGGEIHVSDLVGDDDRGDAGELLDAKARASYRARAQELQHELETARARNDLGRAERIAAELEMITDELVGATGLGGRARKAGSRVERARVNVQRRIKEAIRRLATEDDALGRYLEATIQTGTFCSYTPL